MHRAGMNRTRAGIGP